MHPILGRILGLDVYGYGTALAAAFLVAVILAMQLARKKGLDPGFIIDLAIFACIGGLAGARLLYVLLNLREYLAFPLAMLQFRSGFSFVGGAIGGILVGVWYARRKKQPVGAFADVVAICIPLAYAIGRVGCLLNGCCYGLQSHVPWALQCGPGSILRHPTQIYSSIGGLAIFAILFLQRRHRHFDGFLMFQFGLLYSVERFTVEFFREGTAVFLGLHLTQLAMIATVIASAAAIVLIERRYQRGDRGLNGSPNHEDVQG